MKNYFYRQMTDEQRIEATKTWAAPGKPVRCEGQEAVVQSVHNGYAPGAVYLDRRIDGFIWWNVNSLQPLED